MNFQGKIIQILIIIAGLFAAFWVITSSISLPEYLQISTLVTVTVIGLLLVIYRKLPFDYKMLSVVLMGYALGGKGFAYISPFEPVFIGEITLCVCVVGYVFRVFRGSPLFPTGLHWLIFLWMALVGIFAYYGFLQYGKVAIRDSAIGYYGIFFFTSYAMFRDGRLNKAFGKVLVTCIIFSYIGALMVNSGLYDKIATPTMTRFFLPHADSFIPLIAGGTVYGLLEGIARRSPFALSIGGIGFLLLAINKTAGIFSFICLIGFFLIFARRIDLVLISGFAVTVCAVILGLLIASGSSFVENTLMESDQIKTISEIRDASGTANSSTSDWRIAWWTIVAEDTLNENPMLGVGMGGDITGHFLESVMKADMTSVEAQNYARYPHNIVMTVFGRMGFVGLSLFIVLLFGMFGFCVKYTRRYLGGVHIDRTSLISCTIFMAGVANAMVQATYEVPHGAIINWVCLGFLSAYYHQGTVSLREERKANSLQPAPTAPHRSAI